MHSISKTAIFALLLTSSLTIMVGTVIAPSLTEIALHLGFRQNPGWLITLPSLGVVLFAPLAGRLIDRKGPYTTILWGLIPYAVFGLTGAFLNNPYLVTIDRLLLGAATAAVAASGTALIAILFHDDMRMKMIAWQGMAIELGGVLFLSIGGILGEQGWRWPFLIYGLALICAIFIIRTIRITHQPTSQQSSGKSRSPGLSRNILLIVACSTLAMILFFAAFVGLPVFLPDSFHFTESETGYFMAGISLIAVIAASQMPKLAKKTEAFNIVSLGFIFFSTGLAVFHSSHSFIPLLIGGCCMGIGFGFTVPLLNHMTVEESSPVNRGRNLSFYSMGIFGGQFLSSFITTISNDVRQTFLTAAILAGLVAAALIIKNKAWNKHSTAPATR